MNYSYNSHNKVARWMVAFCLLLIISISPALATAQASAAAPAAAKPAAQAGSSASPAAPVASAASSNAAAPKAAGGASSQEIAAAKASSKVWVNTQSGVYHKSGRWYGKTKAGKFMTEAEAKAAGYKEAHRE